MNEASLRTNTIDAPKTYTHTLAINSAAGIPLSFPNLNMIIKRRRVYDHSRIHRTSLMKPGTTGSTG